MSKRFYSKKSEKLAEEADEAFRASRDLELHEVLVMEGRLRKDPYDHVARCALMGYFSNADDDDENASKQWCSHADWLILNCPDEKLVHWILGVPDFVSNEQFEALKENFLWKVERNSKNANIAGHAARFCGWRDKKLSEKLYKQAKKLAPSDERWSFALCQIHAQEARLLKDAKVAKIAFKQGFKFVRKFETVAHPVEIYTLLLMLCNLAIDFDELETAKQLLKKLKHSELGKEWPEQTHYYACRLAIKEGRIKRAKSQLLKFAKAGPCPDSFDLVQQILDAGEVETVKEYLSIVLKKLPKFQAHRAKYFQKWINQLNDGQEIELVFPKRPKQRSC
jgi:hypothetical protein